MNIDIVVKYLIAYEISQYKKIMIEAETQDRYLKQVFDYQYQEIDAPFASIFIAVTFPITMALLSAICPAGKPKQTG